MKKMLIAMLFILCATGTCADAQTGDLTAIFPDIQNLPKYGEPLVYSPDSLYEYINGAAEIYLQYDFRELVAQEYENADGAFATIEIYHHGSALNAFGIYSQELPFEESNFLNIGAQGYYENSILNFFKGPYYVKLNSYGLDEKEHTILTALATEVAGKLEGTTELPKELAYFPASGKVPHSEQYLAQDVLGYAFLHTAFVTKYVINEQEFQLFLITGDSPQACATMLKDYAAEVGADPASIVEGAIMFDDAYHGTVELRWQGRYVWGVKGLEEPQDRTNVLDQMEKFRFFDISRD